MAVRNIPVVDVHAENVVEYWPALTLAIKSATFIALDLEMSGIGNRKDNMARDSNERYKAFCNIASTRSVLSVGISVFQKKAESANVVKNNSEFLVQTFNVMLLRKDAFTVEPSSLKFLLEHGFDFNTHYAKAIPYSAAQRKGNKTSNDAKIANNDATKQWRNSYSWFSHDVTAAMLEDNIKETKKEANTMSDLFFQMLRSAKPIVLHNGILDLVFLYQNFYTDLPSSLSTFLADLSIMFNAGLFDTKYIAEYHTENSATYLNYIFKKSWRQNIENEAGDKPCVSFECCQYPPTIDVSHNAIINRSFAAAGLTPPCEQYAAHGHCPKGMKCEMSHDIDIILDYEQQKKAKKRKRNKKRKSKKHTSTQECSEDTMRTEDGEKCEVNGDIADDILEEKPVESEIGTSSLTNTASGNHRAGFDAFMTGFCMATYYHRFKSRDESSFADSLPNFVNKLNLSGKDIPLKVEKSSYCKTSVNHNETWSKVILG